MANVIDERGASRDLSSNDWRLIMLRNLGIVGPGANPELNLGGRDLIDPRLMAAARVVVAQLEGEVAGRGLERLGALDRPLSRDNEAMALRFVAGVVALALSKFRTTLDHDLALLKHQDLTAANGCDQMPSEFVPLANEDEVLAVKFRIEKKRILARVLQRLAALTHSLSEISDLRKSSGISQAKKGSKPLPATGKGFGNK